MSYLIEEKTAYDSSEQYYFVDYRCCLEKCWVRSAFNTLAEVQVLMQMHLKFFYDEQSGKTVPMFSDLRITPMDCLNELHRSWSAEKSDYVTDDFTNAAKIYGGMYDNYDWVDPELVSRTKSPWFDKTETEEEWKERVAEMDQKQKERRYIQSSNDRDLKERVLAECDGRQSLATTIGWRMRKDELDALYWKQSGQDQDED